MKAKENYGIFWRHYLGTRKSFNRAVLKELIGVEKQLQRKTSTWNEICGPTIWLINDAPFFDRWDQGLGSELKIRETDVLESKWDEVGLWHYGLWELREAVCSLAHSPRLSRDQTWDQSWHIGGLRSNCCLITRIGILTILEVLLKLTQFWKIIFILALNFNHFIISVQNNETWRWDHPFLCWSSAILRLPVK